MRSVSTRYAWLGLPTTLYDAFALLLFCYYLLVVICLPIVIAIVVVVCLFLVSFSHFDSCRLPLPHERLLKAVVFVANFQLYRQAVQKHFKHKK